MSGPDEVGQAIAWTPEWLEGRATRGMLGGVEMEGRALGRPIGAVTCDAGCLVLFDDVLCRLRADLFDGLFDLLEPFHLVDNRGQTVKHCVDMTDGTDTHLSTFFILRNRPARGSAGWRLAGAPATGGLYEISSPSSTMTSRSRFLARRQNTSFRPSSGSERPWVAITPRAGARIRLITSSRVPSTPGQASLNPDPPMG